MGEYFFQTTNHITYGACISIDGEIKESNFLLANKIDSVPSDQTKELFGKIKKSMKTNLNLANEPKLVNDSMSRALWPKIVDIAQELLIAQKLGRAVSLRFHGDADGVCGAFAISSIVRCKAFQQNSAIYSVRDALRDISEATYLALPLQVIVDFGSGESCSEGLSLLKSAGVETIIIDHHPPGKNDGILVLNPLLVEEGKSQYTAGYLCCEIAAAAGMGLEKAKELAAIACAGDKSKVVEPDSGHVRKAMVLDFLTAHTSFGNNLDFYKKVMDNPELFASIANQAEEGISEAAKKATARMKITNIDVGSLKLRIATFSLDGLLTKGEWPNSSKVTTRIFEQLIADDPSPLLCIGNSDRSIIMRLNDGAVELGLSANDLAEKMKETMPDFIEGGGGHARAGAIRAKEEAVKEVIALLIKEASEKISL
ncbi:hypothetical protein HY988_05530 [Candidatus Micrarchaeota archaeon]|nr:hypothetical protein [Candidatus Micrarchaeota archaeon]